MIAVLRKWFLPRRLHSQVMLIVGLLFLASTAFFSWHITKETQKDISKIFGHHAMSMGASFAKEIAKGISNNSNSDIERAMIGVRTHGNAREIYITDPKGSVVSSLIADESDSPVFSPNKITMDIPAKLESSIKTTENGIIVWSPIVGDTHLGWLIISYKLNYDEFISNTFSHTLLDGLAFTFIAILLVLYLVKKPINLIRQAGEFAGKLDEHRGKTLNVGETSLEIGKLYTSLNKVSKKLYSHEMDVKEGQQRLVRAQKAANIDLWEWDGLTGKYHWSDSNFDVHHETEANLETSLRVHLLKNVHEDDVDMVNAQILASVKECSSRVFDHRMVNKDGGIRYVRHLIEPTANSDGGIIRVLGIVQDITDTRNADIEAKKKSKQIINILESTSDCYMLMNSEWRIGYLNTQAEELIAQDKDSVLGRILWDVVPELKDAFYKPMRDAVVKGEHVEIVGLYPPENRWLEIHVYPHKKSLSLYIRDITESKLAADALRESEAQTRAVLDNVFEAIITIDRAGNITTFNKAAEHIFGYKSEEAVGKNISLLMPDKHSKKHQSYIDEYMLAGKAKVMGVSREIFSKRKNGEVFPSEIALSEVNIASQSYFVSIIRDITLRKSAEQDMRLSEQVFSNGVEGIIVTDSEKLILRTNKAFSLITGFSNNDVFDKKLDNIFCERDKDNELVDAWYEVDRYGRWQGEVSGKRKDGKDYVVWLSLSSAKDKNGNVDNYIAVFNDVTEIKEAKHQIQRLANFDSLTELPNRTLFKDRLSQGIAQAERSGTKLCLLRIDLDRFKTFNDTLGHGVGDALLKKVAERLSNITRDVDTVARISGDEFAILLPNLSASIDAANVARKLLSEFEPPINVDDHEAFVTVSIGGSVYPDDAQKADELVKHAGSAMNHVKEGGRNSFKFYTQDLDSAAFEQLIMENSLRRALERKEFVLFYQPQIDIKTGKVIGVEALIRWNHPELGMVSPAKFIPMLEDTGLIIPVGEWVLEEACKQSRLWYKKRFTSIRMAVNLSPRQFSQEGLPNMVARIVRETKVDPRMLELEITESSLMSNPDQCVRMLSDLKEMDISFAIDDFGTGYSSLSYLTRFPVDTLKIDRSFVMDMTEDSDAAALAVAIISIGHSLNMRVLAEGVETPEQLMFLGEHQCDETQGFLFSQPLPAEEVEQLFDKELRTGTSH